jgi:hypothetical protein
MTKTISFKQALHLLRTGKANYARRQAWSKISTFASVHIKYDHTANDQFLCYSGSPKLYESGPWRPRRRDAQADDWEVYGFLTAALLYLRLSTTLP